MIEFLIIFWLLDIEDRLRAKRNYNYRLKIFCWEPFKRMDDLREKMDLELEEINALNKQILEEVRKLSSG